MLTKIPQNIYSNHAYLNVPHWFMTPFGVYLHMLFLVRAMHGSYFGVTPSGQNTHGERVFKTRNDEMPLRARVNVGLNIDS